HLVQPALTVLEPLLQPSFSPPINDLQPPLAFRFSHVRRLEWNRGCETSPLSGRNIMQPIHEYLGRNLVAWPLSRPVRAIVPNFTGTGTRIGKGKLYETPGGCVRDT